MAHRRWRAGGVAKALTDVAASWRRRSCATARGATKFLTLHITGAPDDDAATRRIANAIGTSPLRSRRRFYGGDANWGGSSRRRGAPASTSTRRKCRLWFAADDESDKLLLFAQEMPTDYSEAEATALVKAPEVVVTLDCGVGAGAATIWTCDLSHDCVSINGHYRT
ncbi:MAG: bifunctional ornithine acetyltransferase/N-acetylglutamate synthase [Anaerolineae bacterium]